MAESNHFKGLWRPPPAFASFLALSAEHNAPLAPALNLRPTML
jgi:hypothetical protein